jgi:hypothetical protein
MPKPKLKLETRMRVMEMATEIVAEAAQNTNVLWMIEFQEELLERLYRKMIGLLEEGIAKGRAVDERDEGGE